MCHLRTHSLHFSLHLLFLYFFFLLSLSSTTTTAVHFLLIHVAGSRWLLFSIRFPLWGDIPLLCSYLDSQQAFHTITATTTTNITFNWSSLLAGIWSKCAGGCLIEKHSNFSLNSRKDPTHMLFIENLCGVSPHPLPTVKKKKLLPFKYLEWKRFLF